MRLFDLVEQHHTVRTTPHLLGQLAAFAVSDITRRGADQPAHIMLLAVFAHIDPHQRFFTVEKMHRQLFGHMGLTHARRTDEHKYADGPVRILESDPAALDRTRHLAHGLVLAYHDR